jgi:hypothetical protein
MKNILTLLMFVCFIDNNLVSHQVRKIRIDPAQAYGGTISEYFDDIEYIPLESTEESMFGDVSQLMATDSSFVIKDRDTRYVLFFTLSGKFITKIKTTNDPTLLTKNNRIGISVYNPVNQITRIDYYTLKGISYNQREEFKNKQGEKPAIYLNNQFSIRTNTCYFPLGGKIHDHLIDVYKNNTLFKSYLPYNQMHNVGFCAFGGDVGDDPRTCVVQDSTLYLCTTGNYIIYKITTDAVTPCYQLVFPAYRTQPSDYINATNAAYVDSIRKKMILAPDIIWGISNVFFGKHTLHFRIDPATYIFNASSDYNSQYNFIYDTLSGRLVSLERISPDKFNYYLPFLEPMKILMMGLYYEAPYFYSPISSFLMFSSKEKNKDKNPQYPSVLQEYFRTQNHKSNPVIVKMKLKE